MMQDMLLLFLFIVMFFSIVGLIRDVVKFIVGVIYD